MKDDTCYNCDEACSATSEYQDDARVFCSLDCLNENELKERYLTQ